MAITFQEKPNFDGYIPYGDNIVLRFSESAATVHYAEILIESYRFRFYPSPDKTFYANIKQIIRAMVVNKNLLDIATYDDSIVRATIQVKTYTVNDALISETAVENAVFIPESNDHMSVVPFRPKTSNIALHPARVAQFSGFPIYVYVVRNGLGSRVLPNFAPEVQTILKQGDSCGTYLKFLNRKGGYSYWLFSRSNVVQSIESYGEIHNDFNSIETSSSPVMQIGKKAHEVLTCSSGMLQEWENEIVKDLFTSSKVFLHLGEPERWLEVKILTSSVKIIDARDKKIDYTITIEKPQMNLLTL